MDIIERHASRIKYLEIRVIMHKRMAFIVTLATFNLFANSGEAAESCEQKVVRLEKEAEGALRVTKLFAEFNHDSMNGWRACGIQLKRCEAMNNLPQNNPMNDMLQEDNNRLLEDNSRTLRQIKRELEWRN